MIGLQVVLTFPNDVFSLCLQLLNSSSLLFRVADSGLNIMWYFSLRQSWHFFVTGLKTLALATDCQAISYGTFSLLSFQMYLLSVVLLLFF